VLDSVDPAELARLADERAGALIERLAPQRSPAALTRFSFALPVEVMASLLGLPESCFAQLPTLVDRYVLAASPLADAREITEGAVAARTLLDLAGETLDRGDAAPLLSGLATSAQAAGCGERAVVLANGVGMLIQAFEATAALIASTLLALGRHPGALAMVSDRPDLLPQAIAETIRWDPSTQNMRRFVGADAWVGGARMRAGEPVLVLAAAAARDPAVNPEPDRFDILRADRVVFGFGRGGHACPAQAIAPAIAAAGLARLLAIGLDPTGLEAVRSYRRSLFRVPLFGLGVPNLR
jgi:cytochrome P450